MFGLDPSERPERAKLIMQQRIILGVFIVTVIIVLVLKSHFGSSASESNNLKDSYAYLNEEVCYAKDIYVKVTEMYVVENEDEKSDVQYYLFLTLSIEQKAENAPSRTQISPSNFELRAINQRAKGKLRTFFEALAKITIETSLELAISGDINIVEETLSLANDYTSERITEIQTNKKLKAIKLKKNSFDSFRPVDEFGEKQIKIVFPITKEYLETDYILVLSIDALNHFERRVFLTVRPQVETVEEE